MIPKFFIKYKLRQYIDFYFLSKTQNADCDLSAHLVRWMTAFLIDHEQRVNIGDGVSRPGYPNRGVPQGTLSGPKHFLVHINDLRTSCPIYEYLDDSTIFELCNQSRVSVIQDSANITVQWSSDSDMRINTSKTQ